MTIAYSHSLASLNNFLRLFTIIGIHDLFNGYGLIAILALIELFANFKNVFSKFPVFLWITPLISFCFVIVSGSAGRMFFPIFVLFIPLTLLFLRRTLWKGLITGQPLLSKANDY